MNVIITFLGGGKVLVNGRHELRAKDDETLREALAEIMAAAATGALRGSL